MIDRPALSWIGLLMLPILACCHSDQQRLPVALTVEPTAQGLQWSDDGGSLTGEPSWVLRTDVLGPDTYLVADTVDSGRRCVEEVTFRVVPIEGIEYSVNLVSDLRGTVSWNVRYGEGRSVRLSRCTPRRTGDPKECLKGGIPKPLFGTLQGMITAKPAGRDSAVHIERLRFEKNPPDC